MCRGCRGSAIGTIGATSVSAGVPDSMAIWRRLHLLLRLAARAAAADLPIGHGGRWGYCS